VYVRADIPRGATFACRAFIRRIGSPDCFRQPRAALAVRWCRGSRSPEDYAGRFSYQDLLVRSGSKGVEIEDLARAQVAPFADLIGSRIVLRGTKLRLNAASPQAVGLALHELTTNAGKYGALSTDTGRLEIGWRTEGEIFMMSWTERDGPRVSPPQRRGFGTVVMQEMAERSLESEVDLQYAPSGVIWRLTCRAVNALEPAS
jgi:two-component sensor histidine kinase